MANSISMFKLGLFVLLGFLVLTAAIVWVGSQTEVKDGFNYVTYFAESIQGVEKGSPVKYQGLDVGKVVKIGVAMDPHLMEVTLSITADRALGQSVMAGIAIRGITGLAYIELLPQDAATVAKSPKLDFPTPYPVIPSYSRGIGQVLSSVGSTVDNLSHVDFAGLANQASKLMATAQDILDHSHIKQTMASVNRSAHNLEVFSQSLARIGEHLETKNVASQLSSAVADSKAITANLRQQIERMHLGELSASASQYVEDMGRTLAQLTENLTDISDKLSYVFANLDALSERLARTPSDVIFSDPPKPMPEETRR